MTPDLARHLESLAGLPACERSSAELIAPHAALDPFLRALLVADGTVTLLLSAYFAEAVQVVTLSQDTFLLDRELPPLQLRAGDEAFHRTVRLQGARSGRYFAGATSLLNPAALDPTLFRALIREDVGMGEVLRNAARGSYREVLEVRRTGPDSVSRTYTVRLDGRPTILITENFNIPVFGTASDQ